MCIRLPKSELSGYVFVILDSVTYGIVQAVEVSVDQAKAIAKDCSWVAGRRVAVSQMRGGVGDAVMSLSG
jgi:hypothetical protein